MTIHPESRIDPLSYPLEGLKELSRGTLSAIAEQLEDEWQFASEMSVSEWQNVYDRRKLVKSLLYPRLMEPTQLDLLNPVQHTLPI